MRIHYARFILACLIALSVAVLPAAAAGAFASAAKSVDVAMSGSMPHCCDHEPPPCDKPAGDMGLCATFSCMAKCFSYVGAPSPGVPMPVKTAGESSGIVDLVLLKIGSPPFRPPRVCRSLVVCCNSVSFAHASDEVRPYMMRSVAAVRRDL